MANISNSLVTFRVVTTASTADFFTIPEPPPPLPFFLDPEQIAELTPHINWSERVSARIEAFREWAMQPVMLAA